MQVRQLKQPTHVINCWKPADFYSNTILHTVYLYPLFLYVCVVLVYNRKSIYIKINPYVVRFSLQQQGEGQTKNQ